MLQVAAGAYEKAWKLTGASSPALGYQLAWNLLKACRYVAAVDVALQVRPRTHHVYSCAITRLFVYVSHVYVRISEIEI